MEVCKGVKKMCENIEILNNTKQEERKFAKRGWGHLNYRITKEQLQEVIKGKAIAIDDGEYTHWIALEESKE